MSHVPPVQSVVSPMTLSSNSSPSVFSSIGIPYPFAASLLLDMCESVDCDKLITASLFVWLSFPRFSLYAANLNPVPLIRVRNA